jgi:hypothetical protein
MSPSKKEREGTPYTGGTEDTVLPLHRAEGVEPQSPEPTLLSSSKHPTLKMRNLSASLPIEAPLFSGGLSPTKRSMPRFSLSRGGGVLCDLEEERSPDSNGPRVFTFDSDPEEGEDDTISYHEKTPLLRGSLNAYGLVVSRVLVFPISHTDLASALLRSPAELDMRSVSSFHTDEGLSTPMTVAQLSMTKRIQQYIVSRRTGNGLVFGLINTILSEWAFLERSVPRGIGVDCIAVKMLNNSMLYLLP